jgi:hypothetical protein
MSLSLGVFVGMNPQLSIACVINLISEEPQILWAIGESERVQSRLTQNFGWVGSAPLMARSR